MKLIVVIVALATILELTCSQTCDPTADFDCGDGNCIPGTNICDGKNDCADGRDEKGDSDSCPPCPPALHQCNNGRCTDPQYICDDDDDCFDGSDEDDGYGGCPDCPSAAFECPRTGMCIVPSFLCDGLNDCGDWADESEETCPCADNEFRCSRKPGEEDGPPGKCIPDEQICDEEGTWNCPNGDDEANCTVPVVVAKSSRGSRVRPIQIRKKINRKRFIKKGKLQKQINSKRHLFYRARNV